MIYAEQGHRDYYNYQVYDYKHSRADEYGYVHYTEEGYEKYLLTTQV